MNDQIVELNRAGYRVAFVIPDSWTLVQWIGAILLLICTLGIYGKAKGLLIIGERIDAANHVSVTHTPGSAIEQMAVPRVQAL